VVVISLSYKIILIRRIQTFPSLVIFLFTITIYFVRSLLQLFQQAIRISCLSRILKFRYGIVKLLCVRFLFGFH